MALRHAQNGSLGQTRISVAVRGAEIRLPPSPRASMRSCPGDTSACPHRRSWFLRPPVRSPLFDRDRQRRDQRRCRVHGGALAGIHHPAAGVHGKAAERPVHVLPSPDYLVSGTSWRFRRRRNSVTFPVEATRPANLIVVDHQTFGIRPDSEKRQQIRDSRNRRIAQNPASTPKLPPAQPLISGPRRTRGSKEVRFDCSPKWRERLGQRCFALVGLNGRTLSKVTRWSDARARRCTRAPSHSR